MAGGRGAGGRGDLALYYFGVIRVIYWRSAFPADPSPSPVPGRAGGALLLHGRMLILGIFPGRS